MSDITDLFEGKLTPIAFITKEWNNAVHLGEHLPEEVQPLWQAFLKDAEAVVSGAEEWAGTAVSAYLAKNGENLQTEILNLLSGLGASGAQTSAAAQDTLTAALKLLLALVAHTVVAFQNANALAAPSLSPVPDGSVS